MKTIPCWLLIPIVALAGALAGCGGKPAAEKTPLPVRVQPVQTYSTSGTVRYSAAIKPDEPVQLAFKNSGYIVAIHQVRGVDGRLRSVQAGDWVAAGTVLARVRDDDYTAKVQHAPGPGGGGPVGHQRGRIPVGRGKGDPGQGRPGLRTGDQSSTPAA